MSLVWNINMPKRLKHFRVGGNFSFLLYQIWMLSGQKLSAVMQIILNSWSSRVLCAVY